MSTPAPASLVLECDELCTFMTRQTKTRWIWLAMDRLTRKIVGCFIGLRDGVGAFGLWQSLPTPYLEARCHTDGLAVYKNVVFAALLVHPVKKQQERVATKASDAASILNS